MVSFDKLASFNDDSDNYESDSGSAGTCGLPFFFNESVGRVGKSIGRVSGVGCVVFVLTRIESIGDVVLLVVFVPKVVESKSG